jgi:hypothetical protein
MILAFLDKINLEAYLEWEKKVKLIFYCHHCSKVKRVKLIVIEFTNYDIIWWDHHVLGRMKNEEKLIETWDEMKIVIRKRFVYGR